MTTDEKFQNASGLGRVLILSATRQRDNQQQAYMAGALGHGRGWTLGAAAITADTPDAAVCRILIGYVAGEIGTMRMQPEPLPDDAAVHDVLHLVAINADDWTAAERLLAIYSESFTDGYWKAIRVAIRDRLESKDGLTTPAHGSTPERTI